jgi:hypothetical protein
MTLGVQRSELLSTLIPRKLNPGLGGRRMGSEAGWRREWLPEIEISAVRSANYQLARCYTHKSTRGSAQDFDDQQRTPAKRRRDRDARPRGLIAMSALPQQRTCAVQ